MDDPYPLPSRDRATWQSDAEKQADRTPRSWRRPLGIAAAALVVVALIVGGTLYWLHARQFVNTDDAFIDAHITQVAPRVAGRVTELLFQDNQHVTAGQVLLRIDPRDYQVKLDQARAQQADAQAKLRQAQAQIEVQQANVDQARANVRVAEAELAQAKQNYERLSGINPHAVSRQEVDNATAAFHSAQARLEAARQAVSGAEAQLAAGHAQVAAAVAQGKQSDADVEAAELQLSYCTLSAPVTGRIAHRNVDVGNYVTPGQPLFAIVQDARWVTANFKETQLAAIRIGQPVDVYLDAVPSVTLHGRVESFQPGTGSAFSVLPAENATGNYVKIVQRVPVRITLNEDDVRQRLLAPGMSVEPYVRVR